MDMFTKSLALELGPHKVSNTHHYKQEKNLVEEIFKLKRKWQVNERIIISRMST